jgi:ElaB/YqjD/DUF883 family membrane-anchored ribosome-binding protein
MTRKPQTTTEDTREVMRETAASLEAAEAVLHHSAEQSPNPATRRRLHDLGDKVTAEADDIAARADRLRVDGHERGAPSPGVSR